MSFEESIAKLAKSNEELAASNLQLAEAMKAYGGVMQQISTANPEKIITANVTAAATPAAEKPARGKKATEKAAPAPAAAEDDGLGDDEDFGLGDEEPAKVYTQEDVREALKAAKGRNADALGKIFGKLGVKGFAQLEEKDYGKAIELAAAVK